MTIAWDHTGLGILGMCLSLLFWMFAFHNVLQTFQWRQWKFILLTTLSYWCFTSIVAIASAAIMGWAMGELSSGTFFTTFTTITCCIALGLSAYQIYRPFL